MRFPYVSHFSRWPPPLRRAFLFRETAVAVILWENLPGKRYRGLYSKLVLLMMFA